MSNFQAPQQLTVSSEYDGQRLDNFLHRLLKRAPRSLVYRIIRRGEVRINGSRARPDRRLRAGDQVRVPPVRMDGADRPPVPDRVVATLAQAVLAETDDYLVLNKPAGMAVHAGSGLPWGLIDAVRALRGGRFVELVHRLDRYTSGCLLLALNGEALRRAGQWFAAHQVNKDYLCLLSGPMPRARLQRDDPLERTGGAAGGGRQVRVDAGGKPAQSEFLRLAVCEQATLARARIGTGRTHQIRVHAQAMGQPLPGDDRYGDDASRALARDLGLRHMLLHSYRLDLPAEAALGVTAPLPESWHPVLDRLFDPQQWRQEIQLQ